MGFGNAFDKLKEQKNKAVQKLPKPLRKKADDKLGLFIHKYIATLFYFDEEIQDIYWEMEEAVQEGEKQKAMQLSAEMKTLINLKADPNSGVSTRKHRQAVNKATEKIQKATEVLKEKNKASVLKDFLKIDRDKDPEDMELSEDIEDMVNEVEN